MSKVYFPTVNKIAYEGPTSTNPFAFKYYNPDEIVLGNPMKDHLRFSMAYWHTFTYMGNDPFGGASMARPWDGGDPMTQAKERVHAAFEFMEKMGMEYFCFHDVDIAPRGATLEESNRNLDEIVDEIEKEMKRTGIKCLWGTTNAFGDAKFVHGASTSCNATVFAYTAAQIKKAMEVTKRLGGENYVFWGGREGYETLLNTDVNRELDHFAALLKMAADYADKIGFTGQLMIEPKPKEPTRHQYDFDAQSVIGFLRKYGLEKRFVLNIEANHATLAQHSFQHELHMSRINGLLGSIDANMGDPILGWDTDQFPTNLYDATLCMYEVLQQGGIAPGGLNFDAKVRRASVDPEDLFLGHIAGMDTFARGLKVAAKLLEDKVFLKNIDERYASYNTELGASIENGTADFESLEQYALKNGVTPNASGRQEMLESILNQYILEA
ncbi:MAG: xylose isomerase [Clostridia bacterium]|nr:xylose isomerase [Clostridia bacterium]